MAVQSLEGRELEACDIEMFYYKDFYFVLVTGASINFCGHALLNIGGPGGYYVHIAGSNKRPHYMTPSQYKTYLAAFQKTELTRFKITVSFPHKSLLFLEDLMSKNWNHWGFFNNCANFVEKVVQAGGSSFNVLANCPRVFDGNFVSRFE